MSVPLRLRIRSPPDAATAAAAEPDPLRRHTKTPLVTEKENGV